MRDQWYGDNRDLVKWGVLLTLVERLALRHILQVLYYRPSKWASLNVGGIDSELPASVVQHFRDAQSITALTTTVPIDVVADDFVRRGDYLRSLLGRIRIRAPEHRPGLVFLDPDTGLAPRSPGPEHVLASELADVWNTLGPGEVLVFYQHQTNRNGSPWVPEKKQQFERALGLPDGSADIARADGIARDVVFFYARRSVD